MARTVDGFGLKYVSRNSWEVRRSVNGVEIDVIPVAWWDGWKNGTDGPTLTVWYRKEDRVAALLEAPTPFIVAVATAKDPSKRVGRSVKEFSGVFEVVPLAAEEDGHGLRCRVVRRITA